MMLVRDGATNKAVVGHYLDEAWNRGNLDIVDELMAPHYVRYTPTAQFDGAGQKQRIADFRRAFPDLRLEIDQILAEDDQVAVRVILRGTHQGPFFAIAPTGKYMTITATDIVRFDNGKIVEHWGNMDELGLLRQLGLLPPPG